jgi:hypothetical protein
MLLLLVMVLLLLLVVVALTVAELRGAAVGSGPMRSRLLVIALVMLALFLWAAADSLSHPTIID